VLVASISLLGLCAAALEQPGLLHCYASLLTFSAALLLGALGYIVSSGLEAVQRWLDRMDAGLAQAGLGEAAETARAEELAQLLQANRLSFALASAVAAFVLVLNVSLACGLHHWLRQQSRGGYGSVRVYPDTAGGERSGDGWDSPSGDEEEHDDCGFERVPDRRPSRAGTRIAAQFKK